MKSHRAISIKDLPSASRMRRDLDKYFKEKDMIKINTEEGPPFVDPMKPGVKWDGEFEKKPRQSVTDLGYEAEVPVSLGETLKKLELKDWRFQKAEWKDSHPEEKGMKFSAGKPRWQLMAPLWPAMEQVVRVLTRGAEKYEDNNWMDVDRDEYVRAIMSHYSAYAAGDIFDDDMGTNHMANLICSALFLLWKDDQEHGANALKESNEKDI